MKGDRMTKLILFLDIAWDRGFYTKANGLADQLSDLLVGGSLIAVCIVFAGYMMFRRRNK